MSALHFNCQEHSAGCQELDHARSDREGNDVQKNWIFIIPAVLMVSEIPLLSIEGS
jgi:hypothetical protein